MGMVLLEGLSAPAMPQLLTVLSYCEGLQEVRHHPERCMLQARFSDYRVTVAHLPTRVPGNDIATLAAHCAFRDAWKGEPGKHASHLLVHLKKAGTDPLRENHLFSEVAAQMLQLEGTVGIYLNERSLLLPKEIYCENLQGENLPLTNWIFFGSHRSGELRSAYTLGLQDFGKPEIEILDSMHSFTDLARILKDVVHYVLQQNVLLRGQDSVRHTGRMMLRVSEQKGTFVPGRSLRIHY